ncbi:MAG: PASTA domain-containing protein [Synergistaceae bacterium]|nr:PASTA domain-containing protein [Synergistaceae bacterium]
MRSHKGGVVLWTLFIVTGIVFASGAIAVYTVFIKPEGKSTVPSFNNQFISDAVAEAEKLGLVVQLENVASTLPEGRVLAQAPDAGTELRKGQVIVLQVSRGGELHAVPDVRGKNLTDAQNEIKSSGFALGDIVRIRENNVQAGNVIAQSPAPDVRIGAGRKIDLLIQDGTPQSEVVKVPDVNRMSEQEARDALDAVGLKVNAIDRVYSPLVPEGLAIETRPAAGSTMRSGQGVTLKLASQRRPAGYMDADTSSTTTANGSVRRVTSQQNSSQSTTQTTTQTTQAKQTTPAPASQQKASTTTPAATTQKAASTTPAPAEAAPKPATQAAAPKTTTTPAASQPASSGGNKTARIRYVVPPIGRPMNLRVEITDPSGKRDVLNRQVKAGDSINTTAKYSQECLITIYLGGESVWQEKQR